MKYIFGNWKMYLDFDESNILANALLLEKFDETKINLGVFPTALAIREVSLALQKSQIKVGAQNVSWVPKGGYTGAVSAFMFKNIGCKYALVGHSERRHIFGETDEQIRKQIEACLENDLIPILCIGETIQERDKGQREVRLEKQLYEGLYNLELNNNKKILVAYEPVWAIGTGENCKPDEANEVHEWLRKEIKKYIKIDVPLLYGGSVKTENVVSYLSFETIDGVLVGGSSTKIDTFVPLIKAVEAM